MLHVATMLWDANALSKTFSRCYDESWVEKLYRGFQRNLTKPFRFVVFTDKYRNFSFGIEQERLKTETPGYGCCIEPFRLNEPSIIVGLDTIVVGNIDHLADYCSSSATHYALPRINNVSNNGVVLTPAGKRSVFDEWHGENDMDWLRGKPHASIDDLWPGQVVSYKLHVRPNGLGDARIVYFHGLPKANELGNLDWVKKHWV